MGTGVVYKLMTEAEERLVRQRFPSPTLAPGNGARRGIGTRMRKMSLRLFGIVGDASKEARVRTTGSSLPVKALPAPAWPRKR